MCKPSSERAFHATLEKPLGGHAISMKIPLSEWFACTSMEIHSLRVLLMTLRGLCVTLMQASFRGFFLQTPHNPFFRGVCVQHPWKALLRGVCTHPLCKSLFREVWRQVPFKSLWVARKSLATSFCHS